MSKTFLVTFFEELNRAQVKYVIVGGLAVNLHGYQRFTRDVDLIISLEQDDLITTIETLGRLGFQPIYPVSLTALADEHERQAWKETRNMVVFSMVTPQQKSLTLDVFIEPPYTYEELESSVLYADLSPTVQVPVIALDHLIEMKQSVGREQDQIDVKYLKLLRDEYLP